MRARALVAAALLAAGFLVVAANPGSAAEGITVQATIDGRRTSDADERNPIKLRPKDPSSIEVQVTNGGTQPVDVRTVRLEGEVLALTFFAYDTSVFFTVAPGETVTRSFELDLVGLGGQATGLIRSAVAILDGERKTLASERLIVDVRGSLLSVYGLFGLALIVLTAVSLAGALIALARHQLPHNRWRRGLRFLTPGLGLGLLVVFTLSALRILVARPAVWVPVLLVSGGGLFVVGYLTPSPDEDDDEDDDEEDGLGEADGEASEQAGRQA